MNNTVLRRRDDAAPEIFESPIVEDSVMELVASDLRFYSVTNFYLSSIQHGIQSFHVLHEMFTKYRGEDTDMSDMLHSWAENYKVMYCLNGGNNAGLKSMKAAVAAAGVSHGLPWSTFNEDEESLDGILTCVGVILPRRIFDAMPMEDGSWLYITKDEEFIYPAESVIAKMLTLLKSCKLAS